MSAAKKIWTCAVRLEADTPLAPCAGDTQVARIGRVDNIMQMRITLFLARRRKAPVHPVNLSLERIRRWPSLLTRKECMPYT